MYKTPGSPGYGVSRPTSEVQKISMEEKSLHWSGFGILLYLVKHSRPGIANAVYEYRKVLDGATVYACCGMMSIIKYVIDTSNNGLKICPIFKKNEP